MEQYEKAFQRERSARERAEESLENKSRELYYALEELVQKQNQLIISEKMASVGLISAGIAHEINNPLSFILSNLNTLDEYFQELLQLVEKTTDVVLQRYNESGLGVPFELLQKQIQVYQERYNYDYLKDDVKALLDESKVGIGRIHDIVKSLKGVSHSQMNRPEEIDLNDHLRGVLKIVTPQIKDKCTIHENYGALPKVECYPDQLSQVFMNLVINSYQAMKSQGEITIQTRSVDDGVEIVVSDTGCGIPQENMQKLFTPFFTTKPIGQGTGLGLSISYDIIKAHGGSLSVESRVDQGSTFTVWLPVTLSMDHSFEDVKRGLAS